MKRIVLLVLPIFLWASLGWARTSLDAPKVTAATIQAYSFTSAPIAKALVDTHKRGVRVEVVLDKSQRTEKYSSADFVAHAGIPTLIDAQHKIAHNKIMVIDGAVVITGSCIFTKSAEHDNAENLLVIRSRELAVQYTRNWEVSCRALGAVCWAGPMSRAQRKAPMLFRPFAEPVSPALEDPGAEMLAALEGLNGYNQLEISCRHVVGILRAAAEK
jgi:phospholipase D-like protein